MKSGSRRIGGFFIATVVVLAVMALSAGPVLAGTEIDRWGKVGIYYLNDGSDFSPAYCVYDTGQVPNLQEIWVHSVTAYARNSTSARDHQKVSVSFVLQKRIGSHKWQGIGNGSVAKADAWDDQSAAFPVPMVSFQGFATDSIYRLILRITWYKQNGTTVAGWARARYNWFTRDDGSTETRAHSCPANLP
jgi:hypothetical protein